MFKSVSTTIALLFVGLALAACKAELGAVYDMTPQQVYAKLLDKRLVKPVEIKHSSEPGTYHRVDSLRDTYVTFAFKIENEELWRYIVGIIPVSENRTRVSVELLPGKNLASMPERAVKIIYGKEAERVFSTIEDRPYNPRKAGRNMLAYIALNPGETNSQLNKAKARAIARAREAGIKFE
ncbi:MAG: hypothetical protein AAF299_10875 [Pseudomonadota bacterium]